MFFDSSVLTGTGVSGKLGLLAIWAQWSSELRALHRSGPSSLSQSPLHLQLPSLFSFTPESAKSLSQSAPNIFFEPVFRHSVKNFFFSGCLKFQLSDETDPFGSLLRWKKSVSDVNPLQTGAQYPSGLRRCILSDKMNKI